MKNILVLTDFSANAKSAEEYGLQLAIKLQVNLVLFNAFPAQDSLTISENVIWPHNKPLSLEYESISNLQARVYELNDELSRISGNIHKPVISHLGEAGALPEKLNAVINKNDIGMVVMGTKGE